MSRRTILNALGVTENDIAALDAIDGGSAAHAEAAAQHDEFRDVVIPARIAQTEAELCALLPDHVRADFRSDTAPTD